MYVQLISYTLNVNQFTMYETVLQYVLIFIAAFKILKYFSKLLQCCNNFTKYFSKCLLHNWLLKYLCHSHVS